MQSPRRPFAAVSEQNHQESHPLPQVMTILQSGDRYPLTPAHRRFDRQARPSGAVDPSTAFFRLALPGWRPVTIIIMAVEARVLVRFPACFGIDEFTRRPLWSRSVAQCFLLLPQCPLFSLQPFLMT